MERSKTGTKEKESRRRNYCLDLHFLCEDSASTYALLPREKKAPLLSTAK